MPPDYLLRPPSDEDPAFLINTREEAKLLVLGEEAPSSISRAEEDILLMANSKSANPNIKKELYAEEGAIKDENLTEYLNDFDIKVRYLHSDINTVERVEIIRDLRKGVFDVLVGINLLREGLDIPEVELVCILDADKEGFLRSERSLVQTMGRAARNINGSVILYADRITNSMQRAMDVTSSRRDKQQAFNEKYGITPKGVVKPIVDILETDLSASDIEEIGSDNIQVKLSPVQLSKELKRLEKEMYQFAEELKFEQAADIRNQIKLLKDGQFK